MVAANVPLTRHGRLSSLAGQWYEIASNAEPSAATDQRYSPFRGSSAWREEGAMNVGFRHAAADAGTESAHAEADASGYRRHRAHHRSGTEQPAPFGPRTGGHLLPRLRGDDAQSADGRPAGDRFLLGL